MATFTQQTKLGDEAGAPSSQPPTTIDYSDSIVCDREEMARRCVDHICQRSDVHDLQSNFADRAPIDLSQSACTQGGTAILRNDPVWNHSTAKLQLCPLLRPELFQSHNYSWR